MATFVAYLAVGIFWALLHGSHFQEFISDASLHVASIVVTRDYLLHGLGSNPLSFLDDAYRRFPLTGFGLWPPGMYLAAGVWAMPFSDVSLAVSSLSVLIAAACAFIVFLIVIRYASMPIATVTGLVALVMPAQSGALASLQLDAAHGLTCVLAAWAFAKYMESGSSRDVAVFAVAALAAAFTKGNGLLIAAVPPIAIALSGQWRLLQKANLWIAGLCWSIPVGVWYAFTSGYAAQGFRYEWGWAYFLAAGSGNLENLFWNLGPIVLVCAGWGAIAGWRHGRRGDFLYVNMVALSIASIGFHCLVPAAINLRYLFAAFLSIVALAGIGAADALARFLPAARPQAKAALTTVCAMAFGAWSVYFGAVHTELLRTGVADMAAKINAMKSDGGRAVLISGSSIVEAGVIAELAATHRRERDTWTVRASKIFSDGGYFRTDYKPRYTTADQVDQELSALAVPLVVTEQSEQSSEWLHNRLIADLAVAEPSRWDLLYQTPETFGRVLRLYRYTPENDRPFKSESIRKLNRHDVLSRLAGRNE